MHKIKTPGLTVSVSTIAPLLEHAASLGLSTDAVCENAHVSHALFEEFDRRISLTQVNHLYDSVIAISGQANIGLKAGYRFGIGSYNILQHLLLSCNTLIEAYQYLCRYYRLFSDEPAPKLLLNNNEALVRWHFLDHPCQSRIEHVMAAFKCWLSLHCGKAFQLNYANFSFCCPDHVADFTKAFGNNLHFDEAHNEMAFPYCWMEKPVRPPNPLVTKALEEQVAKQLQTLYPDQSSWSAKILSVLESQQLAYNANQEEVAAFFHISVRSLSRYLKQENTTLKRLLEEKRISVAKRRLRETQRSIEDIALSLSYSSRRSFDRAFCSAEMQTPSQFRQRRA